jgi:hypothetical protein
MNVSFMLERFVTETRIKTGPDSPSSEVRPTVALPFFWMGH